MPRGGGSSALPVSIPVGPAEFSELVRDRGVVAASTLYSPGDLITYRGRRILVHTEFTSGTGTEPFISGSRYISIGPEGFWYAFDYGVRGDASTDNANALNSMLWRVWTAAKGGTVILPFGVILTSKTIVVPPDINLLGHGLGNSTNSVGTQIKLKDAADCDVIQLMTDNSSAQAAILSAATSTSIVASQMKNAFYASLSNLSVHGNKQGQTPGTYHHGVAFSSSPFNTADGDDAEFDPTPMFFNVYARNCTGNGFYYFGRSDARFVGCVARFNNGFGFRHSFDTHFDNCDAGFNSVGGWYGANGSVRWTGCKSYNNGNAKDWTSGVTYTKGEAVISGGLVYFVKVTGSSTTAPASDATNYAVYTPDAIAAFGAGYYISSTGGLQWAACEAQQNAGSAWHLKNIDNAVLQGQVGSTNCVNASNVPAVTNPNNYAALVLEGSSGVVADMSYSDFADSAYALRITGASVRNDIRISGDNTQADALSPDSISLTGTSNQYRFNAVVENEAS
jgi:hypothetical protein